MRCLFTDKNKAHWQSVQSLAKAKDHKEIRKYVLEAQRISVKTPLIRKCAGDVKFDYPNEQSGPQKAEFDKGELLMLDVVSANPLSGRNAG